MLQMCCVCNEKQSRTKTHSFSLEWDKISKKQNKKKEDKCERKNERKTGNHYQGIKLICAQTKKTTLASPSVGKHLKVNNKSNKTDKNFMRLNCRFNQLSISVWMTPAVINATYEAVTRERPKPDSNPDLCDAGAVCVHATIYMRSPWEINRRVI